LVQVAVRPAALALILSEAVEEVRRLSSLLNAGLSELRTSATQVAEAERAYRKARGVSWVEHSEGTAAFREAQVDASTADLRFARDLAEGVRRAAGESVRSRATQISAVQSLLSAYL
jgi:hypothetical protein